jgi:hypothetical protein
MKKYINDSQKMVCLRFEDGSNRFLRRGECHSTAKKLKSIPKGVVVTEVLKRKVRQRKKKED